MNENNSTIKTEPNDDYDGRLEPANITIKSEITPVINDPVILSAENVIIKEELNIDEILYDESTNTQNWDEDPLFVPPKTQTFKCKICGVIFPETRQLNNHLFIIHRPLTVTGTEAYCNKCSKWFPEIKYPNHNPCFNYMRSIQNGRKMHSCEICDKDFAALSLLKVHLLEFHRPLIVHENLDLSQAILKQIICEICGAVFPLKKLLIHHLTLMHRPYTVSGKGAYCTRCQLWFAEENFKNHRPCVAPVQSVVPVFNCNICASEFKMLHLLKTHLYVIHRPLTLQYCSDAFCDKCNRWFKEDNYTMHKCFRRLTTNIEMLNKYVFTCMICAKEFDADFGIKKHLFDVHRPVCTNEWDKVFCDFCKKCYDEDKFEGHVPCHSVDGKCVFCLITMPCKEHYLLHDLTWKRWRSYQCNMCNLNTQDMRLANLNEHMMQHGKKSIFRCVKCKFDFVSTENAEAHIECFHLGCRCVMQPCICDTYNCDYYYEFVKQRNILDFRGNNKNLLENEINIIRDKQYNSIESNIEVMHMRNEVNVLDSDLNKFNFQVDCNSFQSTGIINILPVPSTSTPTIVEDFSSSDSSTKSENLSEKEEEEIESKIDIVETKLEFDENEKQIEVFPKIQNEHFADVVIERGRCGFGFTLVGQNPCRLDHVVPGSPSDLVGLQNGDSIAEINGCNVLTLTHDTVVSLIKRCAGNVHMKIIVKKPPEKKENLETEVYKCEICNMIFTEEVVLRRHLILRHRATIDEETIEHFNCNKCDKNFIEYLELLYHDPCSVAKLVCCTICSMAKPTLAHYELHKLLYRNEEYVCTICSPLNRVSLSLSAMNEHRKTDHNKIGVFECLKCPLTHFNTFQEIEEHSKQQHLKDNNEKPDVATFKLKDEAQQFKCNTCQKLVDTVVKLKIHERRHERKQTRLLCKICDKTFATLTKLNAHALLHSEERFACHVCNCKFGLKKNLRQHLKVHKDKRRFDCVKCGQEFPHHTSLICHMASHTSEDLFRCGVCKIKYDKQAKLSAHMKVHNEDRTNPNKCGVCGKYFTHKCKLIVHSKMHPSKDMTKECRIEETPRRSNRKRRKPSASETCKEQIDRPKNKRKS